MPMLEFTSSPNMLGTFVNVTSRLTYWHGNPLDVMLVQWLLQQFYDHPHLIGSPFQYNVDGYYGDKTIAGVKRFQLQFGIGKDGIVDIAKGSPDQMSRYVIYKLNEKVAAKDPYAYGSLLNAASNLVALKLLLKPPIPVPF